MALPRHFIIPAEFSLSRHGGFLPCGRFPPPGSPQQPGCASAGENATCCSRVILRGEAVRLRISDPVGPRYGRVKHGRSFRFVDIDGLLITDEQERRRLKELVIPPAWRDVWICPWPSGTCKRWARMTHAVSTSTTSSSGRIRSGPNTNGCWRCRSRHPR
ncbi:hypothetical protein [Streptomyces cyaneofuscatus]|uniref:hypothetical protein n=1 Tax=Streptomyces cyaneofuscatus TaxID=66883 RepID=UPI003664ADA7